MQAMITRGEIPEFVLNEEGLYEGDLCYYFQIVFLNAKNLGNPYHNLRHMLHVAYLCYRAACLFYGDQLTPLVKRAILIAALFHDFDHTGTTDNDARNIERALRGLARYILEEDRPLLPMIGIFIRHTEYPHMIATEKLELPVQILRDADLAQVFSEAWLQQIIIGLAAEQGKPPLAVLAAQEEFLKNLRFHTAWAQNEFPKEIIDAKIEEAKTLLSILSKK